MGGVSPHVRTLQTCKSVTPIPVLAEPVSKHCSMDVYSFDVYAGRSFVGLCNAFDSFFQPFQPRPHEQCRAGICDIYHSGFGVSYSFNMDWSEAARICPGKRGYDLLSERPPRAKKLARARPAAPFPDLERLALRYSRPTYIPPVLCVRNLFRRRRLGHTTRTLS
jgi:hypothetical protein